MTIFRAVASGLGFTTLVAVVALTVKAPASEASPLIGGLVAA